MTALDGLSARRKDRGRVRLSGPGHQACPDNLAVCGRHSGGAVEDAETLHAGVLRTGAVDPAELDDSSVLVDQSVVVDFDCWGHRGNVVDDRGGEAEGHPQEGSGTEHGGGVSTRSGTHSSVFRSPCGGFC